MTGLFVGLDPLPFLILVCSGVRYPALGGDREGVVADHLAVGDLIESDGVAAPAGTRLREVPGGIHRDADERFRGRVVAKILVYVEWLRVRRGLLLVVAEQDPAAAGGLLAVGPGMCGTRRRGAVREHLTAAIPLADKGIELIDP